MIEWKIDIYLKSGIKLACCYSSMENNTLDVSNKLFSGKQFTEFVGLDRPGGEGNIYFMVGEIAAFDIYV